MDSRTVIITRNILWAKVWGIAVVQGAVTLTWVIYRLYLPLLLVELGLAEELALTILIIENALETLVEPIFGAFSDRQQERAGSRLSLISLGAILSSGLLLVILAITVFSQGQAAQWLFLLLTIIWASVMAILRAPAIALLGRAADGKSLPLAASLLTLFGSVVGAFRFDVYGLLLNLGAGFTFTIASLTLLGATATLRWVTPPEPARNPPSQPASISIYKLSLIFLMGILVSWGFRFSLLSVNQILTSVLGATNSKFGMTFFLIILGVAALPAGKIASKIGNLTSMFLGGWGAAGILLIGVLLASGATQVFVFFLLALILGLVLNGVVPFALDLVPASRSGLGVGMYFGGFGGGLALFDLIGFGTREVALSTNAISGSLVFMLLTLAIASLKQRHNPAL
ncbi:MAG: MFS transporter [Cyanobacteria bacterium J06621_8]